MTILQDVPVDPAPPEPAAHPTACPPWCRDRDRPAEHHYGPESTWHWSRQYVVLNPRPLDSGPKVLLRAELVRSDEGNGTGDTQLYIQAEGDVDLTAAEADRHCDGLQRYLDEVRSLCRQMG